jgi:hypothetical protein
VTILVSLVDALKTLAAAMLLAIGIVGGAIVLAALMIDEAEKN